jgi:uncharacterized protein YijF (DUF1287 family)
MASETLFDLRSHISDLRLSALCLCASAPLHLTKLSSFVIVFMQNKANFRKSQVNVSIFYKKDYENISDWTPGENKPNSNPICQRVKLMQSVYLQRIMKINAAKGYEKTNPIQTQYKANLKRAKINANFYSTKDYDNEQRTINNERYSKQTQSS